MLRTDSALKLSFAPIAAKNTSLVSVSWSKQPVSVKTLIKNLPLNRTTYIEHESERYTIITKEAAEESLVDAKLYNISIKAPVILYNCLPLTLMVKITNESET